MNRRPPIAGVRTVRHLEVVVQHQLIRDVLLPHGPRHDAATCQLHKIESIESREIANTFRAAMPNVPWMFVYRDGVRGSAHDESLFSTISTAR
jgi:hypothetical protein